MNTEPCPTAHPLSFNPFRQLVHFHWNWLIENFEIIIGNIWWQFANPSILRRRHCRRCCLFFGAFDECLLPEWEWSLPWQQMMQDVHIVCQISPSKHLTKGGFICFRFVTADVKIDVFLLKFERLYKTIKCVYKTFLANFPYGFLVNTILWWLWFCLFGSLYRVVNTDMLLLDPFHRRGRVLDRKFCLSVCP